MLSTSTKSSAAKKPSGKCAACHKEGASKRCVPCKNAGIDVFFCNRDCQMKAWKKHKGICGSKNTSNIPASSLTTATTCESEKENKNPFGTKERKELKEMKRDFKMMKKASKYYTHCQNCLKTSDKVKLLVCGKCEKIHYCSRQCQKAHWSEHKPICASNCEKMAKLQKSLEVSEKNLLTLLESWKRKSKLIMGRAVCSALTKNEIKQQPPAKIVLLSMEFSYNARTFLLAEEPKTMLISHLFPAQQEILANLSNEHIPGYITQFVMITCKGLETKYASIEPLSIESREP